MKIWAHTLVKDESRWLWYSLASVVDYVDKILLWDTGSTDKSWEIEKEVKKRWPDKIILEKRIEKTPKDFTKVRQEMLDNTKSDWAMVVDGDEIWYEDSIKKVIKTIVLQGNRIESIVVPTINMVGDMFHRQEEMAGRYRLAGKTGHLNLRAFSTKIPGLHAEGVHGKFGWADIDGKRIENRDPQKIKYVDAPYIHTTFLQRSSDPKIDKKVFKRAKKFKYEIGISTPPDFYYPEVFFKDRPVMVPSIWQTPGINFKLRAFIETPLKKIYRRTFLKNKEYGY